MKPFSKIRIPNQNTCDVETCQADLETLMTKHDSYLPRYKKGSNLISCLVVHRLAK